MSRLSLPDRQGNGALSTRFSRPLRGRGGGGGSSQGGGIWGRARVGWGPVWLSFKGLVNPDLTRDPSAGELQLKVIPPFPTLKFLLISALNRNSHRFLSVQISVLGCGLLCISSRFRPGPSNSPQGDPAATCLAGPHLPAGEGDSGWEEGRAGTWPTSASPSHYFRPRWR